MIPPPENETLRSAIDRLEESGRGLLGIGMPRCPASSLLTSSLGEIAAKEPDLAVAMVSFAHPDDWAQRESLLWPRGIRVSRASVPVVARLRGGKWTTRQGAAPASVLASWLTGDDVTAEQAALLPEEERALEASAARRAQHAAARGRGVGRGAE